MAQVNSILCTGSAKFLNKIYGACTDGTNGTTKYMRQDGTWQVPPNDQFTLGISGAQQIVLSKNGTAQTPITVPYATTAGSATPTSHTHGNITNDGKLQTTDVAIASGDKLVITDSSNSSKVARSSLAFSAAVSSQSQSTKFLREDGTWAAPSYTTNTNTWRNIKINGTEKLGTGTGTGAVDFINGDATTVAFNATGNKISYSHNDTSSQASVSNSGRTYIQSITLDGYGHVTGLSSATETVVNTDRYVNSAAFAYDTTNKNIKMTLTRAGSDSATVTANIPLVSASTAGIAPIGASVTTQSQSTKFLREDGTWQAPTYTVNTDTKVTSVGNHYAPAADSSAQLSASATGATAAWSIDVVKAVQLQRDAKGHVVGVTVTSGKIPGNPNTDVNVTQTATNTNANYEVLFSGTADNTTCTEGARKYSNLTFNPSTGTLTSTILTSGTVNADTANITEDNVGNLIVTGAARFLNTINGSVSGTSANVTGTVAIPNGGTGATTAANARANLGTPYMYTDSYPTLLPANGSNNWIKIGTSNTSYGLLPSTSGGAGSGHNYIGTSSWYWKYAYIDEIYGVYKGTITKSQVSDFPSSLPASNTVDTYDSASGDPISGKGVADALASLPSPTGGTVTSVTIKGTSPIVSSSETAITTSGTRTISHATSGVTAGTYKSVTVDTYGHVTAGTNPTTLSGYGITDAKIASGTITLGSNTITPLTSSSTLDATKLSGTIPTSCYTDTKNTAGSTDTSSKIFLIGATSQGTNPQTYSHDTAYVGTDGCLYSGGTKVLTSHQDISGKLNKSGGEITGTVYSQTSGANFEVYSPSGNGHKMRFTATDTPRSGLYDMIDSRWAFWKNQEGEYQIGPNGYAVQARTQAKGTTKYPLRDGVVFAFRSGASSNTITVACISQWEGDSVVYQHHVSTINVTIDVWHETIKVANNTNGNIQVIMIGQFNDNSMF